MLELRIVITFGYSKNFNNWFFMAFKRLTVLWASSVVLMTACGENVTNKESEEISDTVNTQNSTSLSVEEEQDVFYNLPSALQLAYVFKKSSTEFIPSLPNDKANVSKYNVTNYKKAINFGVYSSDLAYCLFNKKYQESKDYLKTCKELGSYLGLNQAFENDNLIQRFDQNISREDSLIKIVSSVQLKTDILFEQNKQKHVTVVVFSGAWIESMYIASEVYAKTKNKKALSSLLEQLVLAETVSKALKSYEKSEAEIGGLLVEVEKLNRSFHTVAAVKASLTKDEELDVSGIILTPEELSAIVGQIKSLRKGIVD